MGHNEFPSTDRADGNNHLYKCILGYILISELPLKNPYLEITSTDLK